MYGNWIWDHDLAQHIWAGRRAFLFTHFMHGDGWLSDGNICLVRGTLLFLHWYEGERQDCVFSFEYGDI